MKNENEGRRYPRYSIPILIEAPSLGAHPLVPENISQSGFRVTAAEEPKAGEMVECAIAVMGKLFEGCVAKVEWVRGNEIFTSSWAVGLSVEIDESRRSDYEAALEEVFESLGEAP